MPGWRVWGELRRRPHIELVFETMPDNAGLIEDIGEGRRRITIDTDLDQCERRAVLAHELIHDEREIFFTDDTPLMLIVKEESNVEAETTRRLVPIDELEVLVTARVLDGGTVEWRDVAEWFDVPREISEQAMEQLQRRARRRHASERPRPVDVELEPLQNVRMFVKPSPLAEDGPHIAC
jgi:hypothetical protein